MEISTVIQGKKHDEQLAKRVYHSMLQLGYRKLSPITCTAEGAKVVLQGEVSSYYLMQVAQTIAAKVPGVHGVENRLSVKPAPVIAR